MSLTTSHWRLGGYLALVALASALVGAVLVVVYRFATEPGPPMTIAAASPAASSFPAGGVAVLNFDVVRDRACPAVIYGFLVGENGRALHRYEPEVGGYTTLGKRAISVHRPIPPGISGSVCYRHTRIDSCETRTYITAPPDVCFNVTP